MGFNVNGGYGRIEADALASARTQGNTIVVCPSSSPAYNKLVQAFGSLADPLGNLRFAQSINDALNFVESGRGDIIYIAEGGYNEIVTINKSDLTIVGLGGAGATYIAPSTTNAIAVTITDSSDISFKNIGFEGNGTGGGLLISGDCSRVRVIDCKAEGGAFGIKLNSTAAGSVSDTRIINSEIAWTLVGIHFAVSGGGDPVTQTRIEGNLFHNNENDCILVDTVHSADIFVVSNTFSALEDGSAPSNTYIDASVTNTTGIVTKNSFAYATNSDSVFVIASGVKWVANATEAGITTARPS